MHDDRATAAADFVVEQHTAWLKMKPTSAKRVWIEVAVLLMIDSESGKITSLEEYVAGLNPESGAAARART